MKAFRIAEFATRNREDALDIVQDAMIKLARHYADRPETEWPVLFRRILQNTIVDWHRKSNVKNRLFSWFGLHSAFFDKDEAGEYAEDAVQMAKDEHAQEPEAELIKGLATEQMINAVSGLPLRQQQAFLLRCWEGLSVKETAEAMECSEGSVKTHYSRAIHRLKGELQSHWERGQVL